MIFKILFIPVVFDYKGMKRFLKRENYFTDICLTFTNKLKPSVLLQLLNTHLEDVLDEFICGFILEFGEFADDNLLLLGLEHIRFLAEAVNGCGVMSGSRAIRVLKEQTLVGIKLAEP